MQLTHSNTSVLGKCTMFYCPYERVKKNRHCQIVLWRVYSRSKTIISSISSLFHLMTMAARRRNNFSQKLRIFHKLRSRETIAFFFFQFIVWLCQDTAAKVKIASLLKHIRTYHNLAIADSPQISIRAVVHSRSLSHSHFRSFFHSSLSLPFSLFFFLTLSFAPSFKLLFPFAHTRSQSLTAKKIFDSRSYENQDRAQWSLPYMSVFLVYARNNKSKIIIK